MIVETEDGQPHHHRGQWQGWAAVAANSDCALANSLHAADNETAGVGVWSLPRSGGRGGGRTRYRQWRLTPRPVWAARPQLTPGEVSRPLAHPEDGGEVSHHNLLGPPEWEVSWWDPPVLPGPQPWDDRQAHTFIFMSHDHDISHNGYFLSDCWLDRNSDIYLGGRGGKFAGLTEPLLFNLKRLMPDSGSLPSPHPRQREEGQHDVQSAQLGGLPWRLVQVNKYWDCNIRSYLICNLGGMRELCGEHQDSTVRLSISCSLLLKPKQTSEPAQRPISRGLEEARVLLSSKTLALQPSLSQYQSMSWLHTVLKFILMIMIPKFPLFPYFPMNFTMNFSINILSLIMLFQHRRIVGKFRRQNNFSCLGKTIS